MQITDRVKEILSFYDSEPPAIKAKLYQLLMTGRLAETGKLVILPVDQGFEHGPTRSFAKNPAAYDPDYFFELAIEAKISAYAAPFGLLNSSMSKFAGRIPTILKLNSSNLLFSPHNQPDQAISAAVKDALNLGCIGVGFTIYPGSDCANNMIEEAKEVITEAKSYGLITVIWSYPRGGNLTKEHENAIDVCAYGAHIAALLGAHIIKVKLPSSITSSADVQKIYESENIQIDTLTQRVEHIVQSCFNGKRLVVFSGGAAKSEAELLAEITAINQGNGNGSIIGRNAFQRSKADGLSLLDKVCEIYATNK